MKKILILVLLSFVLISCGNNNQIKSDAEKGSENNAQNTIKHTREDCMKGCEMLGNATNVTAEEKSKNCNGLCDFQQGIQENDTSYCEKSTGTYKSMCYSTIAKNIKDVKLCEKIPEKIFLYSCYQTLAEETKDVKLCDKITDKLFKDGCLEKFKK